ncbi:MAG: hemolysin family protein [Chlamydiota bacterium]
MTISYPLFCSLFFLLLLFAVRALQRALRYAGYEYARELFRKKMHVLRFTVPPSFFQKMHESFFQMLRFFQQTLTCLYAIFACEYGKRLIATLPIGFALQGALAIGILIFSLFFADLLALTLATTSPKKVGKCALFFLLFFLWIASPLIAFFVFLQQRIEKWRSSPFIPPETETFFHKVLTDDRAHFEANDQKWILAFFTFKKRIAKEIMIPRIDITAIDESTSLQEAAELFLEERYSRIPVYAQNLDEVTGVLLYKDLFHLYITKKNLNQPVKSLVKPVIYAPESKKISSLLQEFRSKQLHFAVIVNEYGGTEGIVTIEDILEELVGEIEDEYDAPEKAIFWKLPNGSWVVDAKMSTIDVAGKIGIEIPQSSEYETLGGYIFDRAGTIPLKGWSLHHDTFSLEVLESSERAVEKIRITPKKPNVTSKSKR